MLDIQVTSLGLDAAAPLAGLMASHLQEVRGGEPPRPDRYYAEKLLADRRIGLMGARLDGELIGFVVFHELPDCISGLDGGLIDTVYVRADRRGHGAGRAMLEALTEEGRKRAWSRLRWSVDETRAHSSLPERVAMPETARSFVVPITRQ
jgi:GNAT superfamily N-acetyltransferase